MSDWPLLPYIHLIHAHLRLMRVQSRSNSYGAKCFDHWPTQPCLVPRILRGSLGTRLLIFSVAWERCRGDCHVVGPLIYSFPRIKYFRLSNWTPPEILVPSKCNTCNCRAADTDMPTHTHCAWDTRIRPQTHAHTLKTVFFTSGGLVLRRTYSGNETR